MSNTNTFEKNRDEMVGSVGVAYIDGQMSHADMVNRISVLTFLERIVEDGRSDTEVRHEVLADMFGPEDGLSEDQLAERDRADKALQGAQSKGWTTLAMIGGYAEGPTFGRKATRTKVAKLQSQGRSDRLAEWWYDSNAGVGIINTWCDLAAAGKAGDVQGVLTQIHNICLVFGVQHVGEIAGKFDEVKDEVPEKVVTNADRIRSAMAILSGCEPGDATADYDQLLTALDHLAMSLQNGEDV